MKILNNLKRNFTLKREALEYITKYQEMYKRVLKEAKKETMIGMLYRHLTKQKLCSI
jgi:hypothetical protein